MTALLLLSACGTPPGGLPAQEDEATPAPVLYVPVEDPDDPDPAARSGAAARALDCDGGVANGSTGANAGVPDGRDTPEQALEAFLELGLFLVPRDGYRRAAQSDERVLFVHERDGARVAVVVARAGVSDQVAHTEGWGVETVAFCDPSEYGLAEGAPLEERLWYDADGRPAPTTVLQTHVGPAHCDWQRVTFLYLEGRQYLRDPDGTLRHATVGAFAADTALPDDAVDTGYRRGDRRLWRAADERAVYVVTGDVVERWPAARETIACA